jgi:hypothetical protein
MLVDFGNTRVDVVRTLHFTSTTLELFVVELIFSDNLNFLHTSSVSQWYIECGSCKHCLCVDPEMDKYMQRTSIKICKKIFLCLHSKYKFFFWRKRVLTEKLTGVMSFVLFL